MQIERLLQIIFLLIKNTQMTAKELASYFEVSTKTIYRDVDTLTLANIPIYATKGKGGGIGINQEYKIDKSMLTKKEIDSILLGLQTLKETFFLDGDDIFTKITALFPNNNSFPDWIDIDFTMWGSKSAERERFYILQNAIINKKAISFIYYNSDLISSKRNAVPIKLMFKSHTWYVYSYCLERKDYRLFRLSRIKNITLNEMTISHEFITPKYIEPDFNQTSKLISFKILFDKTLMHRIFDEFSMEAVEKLDNDSLLVTTEYPICEWTFQHILSFGHFAEVLEPREFRQLLHDRVEKMEIIYSKENRGC